MGQKVSRREIEQNAEQAARRSGVFGLVQCDGCPAGVLVQPARPGHRDSCDLCATHCTCFRVPDGIDFHDEWD